MADSEDTDSRTASVVKRTRSNYSFANTSSDSQSNAPRKRQRSNKRLRKGLATSDFVRRGAAFSEFEIDPETSLDFSNDEKNTQTTNPNLGSTAPAISWNKGSKRAVRTTLGRRSASSSQPSSQAPASQTQVSKDSNQGRFTAINDVSSSQPSSQAPTTQTQTSKDSNSRFTTINDAYFRADNASDNEQGTAASDSDESMSMDSENDDSLILNIGTEPQVPEVVNNPEALIIIADEDKDEDAMDQDKINDVKAFSSLDLSESNMPESTQDPPAHVLADSKYSTPPSILRDLDDDDFEDQVKFVYWDRSPDNCYGDLPVGCRFCLQKGHISEICPLKRCTHCQAWGDHQTVFCPIWLRCDRCRQRGHKKEKCQAVIEFGELKEGHVPCDICHCPWHEESRCNHLIMPFSQVAANNDHFTIALQCARCLSFKHLFGDCPYMTDKERFDSPLPKLGDVDPIRIENMVHNGSNRRDPALPPYIVNDIYYPSGGRTPPAPAPKRKKKHLLSNTDLPPTPQVPSRPNTSAVPIVPKPRYNGVGPGAGAGAPPWRAGKSERGAGDRGRGRGRGFGRGRGGGGRGGGRGQGRGGRG